MGRQLNLTERTVKGYVSQLFLIFDITNRTELIGLFVDDSIGTKPNGLAPVADRSLIFGIKAP
jgi:hypothetical protein